MLLFLFAYISSFRILVKNTKAFIYLNKIVPNEPSYALSNMINAMQWQRDSMISVDECPYVVFITQRELICMELFFFNLISKMFVN